MYCNTNPAHFPPFFLVASKGAFSFHSVHLQCSPRKPLPREVSLLVRTLTGGRERRSAASFQTLPSSSHPRPRMFMPVLVLLQRSPKGLRSLYPSSFALMCSQESVMRQYRGAQGAVEVRRRIWVVTWECRVVRPALADGQTPCP